MKADKQLEWRQSERIPNRWQAFTEDGFMPTYEVVPSERGDWLIGGADQNSAEEFGTAKQICQDHYNRRRRLKAWEDYMATHEVPEG